jgi:hypothetical protein
MSFDKWEREACAAIPHRHARILSGELRPDDLVWSWTSKEWLRQDDPGWLCSVARAEDAVCAVRSGRVDTRGFASVRRYSIKKPPVVTPAAVVTRDPSLFD